MFFFASIYQDSSATKNLHKYHHQRGCLHPFFEVDLALKDTWSGWAVTFTNRKWKNCHPKKKKVWKSRVFELEQRNIQLEMGWCINSNHEKCETLSDDLQTSAPNWDYRRSSKDQKSSNQILRPRFRFMKIANTLQTYFKLPLPNKCKQNLLVLTHMAPPHPSEIIWTSSSNPDTSDKDDWLGIPWTSQGHPPYYPRCLVSTVHWKIPRDLTKSTASSETWLHDTGLSHEKKQCWNILEILVGW